MLQFLIDIAEGLAGTGPDAPVVAAIEGGLLSVASVVVKLAHPNTIAYKMGKAIQSVVP